MGSNLNKNKYKNKIMSCYKVILAIELGVGLNINKNKNRLILYYKFKLTIEFVVGPIRN